jgi:hypothetical protein
MRTLAIVGALALLTCVSARADAPFPPAIPKPPSPKVPKPSPAKVPKSPSPKTEAPSPATLPSDVQQLRDEWMQCTAAAAKADLRSSRPAEDVADAALQRCKAQEQPLARALNRQLGKDGAARVLERVRETDRSNLIRAIEQLRARQD